jgi:hypothetical protein
VVRALTALNMLSDCEIEITNSLAKLWGSSFTHQLPENGSSGRKTICVEPFARTNSLDKDEKKIAPEEFGQKNLRTPPCALRAIRIGLSTEP